MLTNLPIRPRSRNSIDAGDFGEQGIVLADADVHARLDLGAALAHDDRPAGHKLPAESLHAQPLRIRIATVFRTA